MLTGTSHPYMLKDELVEKATGLAEQRALLEFRKRQGEFLPALWKKGAQEDYYTDVLRFQGENQKGQSPART